MQRLTTENEAALATRSSETMDTLLLMSAKDGEIMQLREQLTAAETEITRLKSATPSAPPPPPPPAPAATGSDSPEAMKMAIERAERAEAEAAEVKQQLTKVQAKLNAVSTLYTEAAQREAVLRIQLEQGTGAGQPSYE